MSHASAFDPRSPGRRDLLIGAALAAAAVVAVTADCILYQIATGGAQPLLASKWLLGAVAPWTAAFVALRARVSALGGRPSLAEAGWIGAAFAGSLALDAALIPPQDWAEFGARVQARLALALLVPLAARLRLVWAAPRGAAERAAPDRRLADARLVTAAGNYVEAEGPNGRRLIRMTIAEAQARMDPARVLRIHRGTLVARDLIDRLERDRNGVVAVRLTDGRRLRVGPSHRAAVRRAVEG
ncbi:MAG TPA: LytTR family DNA-binding domain-containing protein [Caulobacter sp.]|nr:LytTR family DNA-binding domain-containing protein [Caulobacter sp.]